MLEASPAFLSLDELERRWRASAAPRTGAIAALVVRLGDGAHATPERVELCPERGVVGDRWSRAEAPNPEAQVSVIDRRVAEVLVGGDRARLHVPGDNLVADVDVDEASLPVGARLRLGAALLEVTAKLHTGCVKFKARVGEDAFRWVNAPEHRARRLRGFYLRVVEAGVADLGAVLVRA